MKFATIDVGSNSILLYIVEKDNSGKWKAVVDIAELSRLGEGLSSTGVLGQPAMDRSVEVLKNFSQIVKENNVSGTAVVGTMALRTAKNAQDFIDRVKSECGIKITVIPGEEEARLSYLAVVSGLGLSEGKTAIFDVGGGSTEFIFGQGDKIINRFSVNIGAIRFTENFLKSDPASQGEIDNANNAVKGEFEKVDMEPGITSVVGMGGTVTNLTGVMHKLEKYNPDIVQGAIVTKDEILRQIEMYSSMKIEERKKITGLQPKRADVILAGVLIIKNIMDKTGQNTFRVSDRGIRHGLMYDKFGKA
jgi:exopolyphosphatase / guanosine-5'-triphosphate,3'-diphosphate pyrophosphatase